MECLAIIPARGGSKGIPRKNVLPLAGKPLIAHNIEQAHRAQLVSRVVVSTDDPEIAAISQAYGAEVVWRPAEISGDSASSESALLHVLEHLREKEGYQADILAFLQCTSPLTLAADIDGTIHAMLDTEADTALAVIPFHYFIWRPGPDGDLIGVNHDKHVRPLRQAREPQYLEAGAVYAMRIPGFLLNRHRFFGKTCMYIMPAERRLEIDDPVDFEVAEVLMRSQRVHDRLSRLPEKIAALILDFDGVITDNKVLVLQDGSEAVLADRSDGWGIGQLKKTGLPMWILSTEPNPVVQARASKLGIPCLQGLGSRKGEVLRKLLAEQHLNPAEVIFVGNDDNDLECMAMVGCAVAPADAYPKALARASLVLEHKGGDGALRELCELILLRLSGELPAGDVLPGITLHKR
ncbi:MAG TPA: acylneuraminate cytidylyltransferase [Anaerolineales bacterium]|nr:acylneuraminate cytidylyltransferase [Anaerolineales bacterium]